MLIQNGADINTKYYKLKDLQSDDWVWVSEYEPPKMTPLEIAKERGHLEVIKVLIAAEARE
jgi:ankyrin repeat protein